jgi:heterodisulfide reductase subunit D
MVTCPGGVRTDQLFAKAKQAIAGGEFLPVSLKELDERIRETGNISGEENENRLLWRQNLESPSEQKDDLAPDVLFFVGCVASLYPMAYAVPQSLAEIMGAAGLRYDTLGAEEWCCGYPLLTAGLPADEVVERNVARVKASGAKKLVAACPSCFHTWKEFYPDIGVEVLHATELVAELIREGSISFKEMDKRVTYHDPCDLGRKADVYEAPRQILEAIPGLEVMEMESNHSNSLCCGGGGNMESLDQTLSWTMADNRLAQAQSLEVDAIVSSCQQCERTLNAAARRQKSRLKTLDIVQLVRMAMNGVTPT